MPFGGENAESYYDEGLTAVMKGDVKAAIEFFTHAIKLDSSFIMAYHQLGRCFLRIGQTDRAVHVLQQVLARKPNLIPARIDLGYALLQHGNIPEARAQFSQVVQVQADSSKGHLGLAHVEFQLGNWSQATALAQAARSLGSAGFAVLFLLGKAAKLDGDHPLSDSALKEALAQIEKPIELNPDAPEGHYLRGEIAFVQERYFEALDSYRAAESRTAADASYSAFGENFTRLDVLVKEGLCLQRMGDKEAARAIGARILQLSPGHKLGQALSDLK
ncbi:MAG TPA: tetratricopeptide repeat protein [Candidatus Bathyarchaeia archaeon]|nr:tetratricopeptide repeat protein [Candidatus Bathyarchaeia archaeon]